MGWVRRRYVGWWRKSLISCVHELKVAVYQMLRLALVYIFVNIYIQWTIEAILVIGIMYTTVFETGNAIGHTLLYSYKTTA